MDKAYPVNITQTEEFHAFFAKLDEWKNKGDSFGACLRTKNSGMEEKMKDRLGGDEMFYHH